MGRPRKFWIDKSTSITVRIPNKLIREMALRGEKPTEVVVKLLKEKYNFYDKD